MRKKEFSIASPHRTRTRTARIRDGAIWRLMAAAALMLICGLASASPPHQPATGHHPPSATPSPDEQETLRFLLEQRRLVRDIYRHLHGAWEIPAFADLAGAEQRGIGELQRLHRQLRLRHLPADGEPGIFADPALGQLYRRLLTQGLFDIREALELGALIEEMSIIDLRDAIDESRSHRLDQIYIALLGNAYAHLRAIHRQLARSGVDYQPRLLPREGLEAILNNALVSPEPSLDLISQVSL